LLLVLGRLREAEERYSAARDITADTTVPEFRDGPGWFAAFRGDAEAKADSTAALLAEASERWNGQSRISAAIQDGILFNSLGRYDDALAAMTAAGVELHPYDIGVAPWMQSEIVEAAARVGDVAQASAAVEQLQRIASATQTDWAVGLATRAEALVADDADAEQLYRAAIERLSRTRVRMDAARARLLFGEWLRRQNRRVEARDHLRPAHEAFSSAGAHGWAERTRRELGATGEIVHRSASGERDALTTQERQIAKLAASGNTNPEIGAQLFLSPRTVEWHLRKVFTKLGVTSRRQLARVLRDPADAPG
jgi:ATP/maltotriose-dependent transcriptional regulator MalT